MPGPAVGLIGERLGERTVGTPPLDSGRCRDHGGPSQRVAEHEPMVVLIDGDQTRALNGSKAALRVEAARCRIQDGDVPGLLQRREQEQCAAGNG